MDGRSVCGRLELFWLAPHMTANTLEKWRSSVRLSIRKSYTGSYWTARRNQYSKVDLQLYTSAWVLSCCQSCKIANTAPFPGRNGTGHCPDGWLTFVLVHKLRWRKQKERIEYPTQRIDVAKNSWHTSNDLKMKLSFTVSIGRHKGAEKRWDKSAFISALVSTWMPMWSASCSGHLKPAIFPITSGRRRKGPKPI